MEPYAASPSATGRAARRRVDAVAMLLLGIALFAAVVRIPRLHTPSKMFFDEIYYAKAAQQILAGKEVTEERTHPPLSKLIIAAAIAVAGDDAFGWRIAPAIAGTLLVVVVYLLADALFGDRFIAAISAMLVAVDGLVFVESRIAKPDIFLTLFLFGAFAAFWKYVRERLDVQGGAPPDVPESAPPDVPETVPADAVPITPSGRGVRWLYLAGCAAGCAIATKWTTVVPLSTIPVMLLLFRGWGRIVLPRTDLRHVIVAFTIVPAAVYLLTYIPYFMLGHSAGDFVKHQISMYDFHASLTAPHPYQSHWWSWPLLLRPIWYEYHEVAPQVYRGILAIGNPVIWWASLPAFAFVAVRAIRLRSMPEAFLATGFAISYIQYAFITRALFLYHFLPALLFLIMALAAVLARIRARVGGGVVLIFLVLAVGWLVAFYPVLSALPIHGARYLRLMWFRTWI
ncbi:MAG: phospholipid carrier-dependent glycosyltransferase [Armatimonadota bacterium]